MRYTANSILISIFLITACTYSSPPNFILGKWKRINDIEGRQTFEHWVKIDKNTYKGLGFTIENNDTVFKENLRIIKLDGNWKLEVTGVNPEPTYFKFTSFTDISFECENPKNEFPKKIAYIIKKDSLIATISDSNNEIIFSFVKINKQN